MLRSLINALDYMYYRVAKAYMKWDGKHAITSLLSISLFLYGLVCFPIIIVLIKMLGKPFFYENLQMTKTIIVILIFLFLGLVYLRYGNSFDRLDEKYKTEGELAKKVNGFFVVFALLFPWLLLIIGAIVLR
jgi:hypothetical protein